MKKVGIIILNYNNADTTLRCVESIKSINYSNYLLVIVDNYSTDNSYEFLKKNLEDVDCLLRTDMNGGYAYGNNMGIRYVLERECEYVLILNNDVILENDTLEKLVNYSEKQSGVGVVGPAILEFISGDGIIQSTGANNNMFKGTSQLLNHGRSISALSSDVLYPDYLGGSCLLVSKKVIREVGLIPEDYFLFYEENEWCLKIRKNGYKIICDPEAKVYHFGSESINKINGLSYYFMIRNVIIFERRNASDFQFIIFIIYIFIKTISRSLRHPNHWKDFLYYFDGFVGKNRYEYLKDI